MAGPCGPATNGWGCSPINVKRSRTYVGGVRNCSVRASIVRWLWEAVQTRMVAYAHVLIGLVAEEAEIARRPPDCWGHGSVDQSSNQDGTRTTWRGR
jgi:hypothetical protein